MTPAGPRPTRADNFGLINPIGDNIMRVRRSFLAMAATLLLPFVVQSAEPSKLAIEEQPKDLKLAKIVLVAGSNFFKPGEHEYVPGCALLMDLLRQTPGVFPILAIDWPKKPETFAGAKAVVFFFDGGDKHALLKADRLAEVQKLVDGGVGLVHLHQVIDYPKDLGDRARGWTGAAWEKGFSQRAHWVAEFKSFPDHPVCRGVTPFKIDDGWLYKLRFVPELKGVTPLLSTVSPKAPPRDKPGDDAIVSWACERSGGGRSFTFTGCHLHSSFNQEGYRRFLVNGILWSAGLDVPKSGAPVAIAADEVNGYLKNRPAKSEEPKR